LLYSEKQSLDVTAVSMVHLEAGVSSFLSFFLFMKYQVAL